MDMREHHEQKRPVARLLAARQHEQGEGISCRHRATLNAWETALRLIWSLAFLTDRGAGPLAKDAMGGSTATLAA
jgi:hypothetical protein